jgi:GNAT superfamily N-acetyltransferase
MTVIASNSASRPPPSGRGRGACREDGPQGQTKVVTECIRPAVAADLDAMTAMAADRRSRYAKYQPVFWRPASDAEQVHRPYLAELIAEQDVITLLSDDSGNVAGFLIAAIGDAPAVYDPGSRTCTIDDFVVAPGRWATTGVQLLRAAIEDAAERGAIQAVVVTTHLDQTKREALQTCELSVASEWRVVSWPATVSA